MRITLDSAILVRSHQRATGLARALLLELLDAGHSLVLSGAILDELERVLFYPRLLRRSGLTPDEIAEYLEFLSAASQLVEIDETFAVTINDPDDIHVLQTAVAGRVDVICTRDSHFYESGTIAFCASHGIECVDDIDLLGLIRGKRSR